MNDPVRPTSYYRGGIAPSAPGGVLATVPNPPPDIARLPAGTTLRGVVLGTDSKGHVLVKTDQGTLAVTTKAILPKNSEVVLQIRSSGTQLHIMIMQVRNQGVTPDALPQPATRTADPLPGSGGATAQAAGHRASAAGNRLALPPTPTPDTRGGAASSPGRAGPLNLGQVVRAVVQGLASPNPTSTAPQSGAQGPAAGAGTSISTPSGQPLQPPPGTVLALRILSVSTPGPAPSLIASPGPEPAVTSTQGARAYAPAGPRALPGSLASLGGTTVALATPPTGVAANALGAAETPALASPRIPSPAAPPAAVQPGSPAVTASAGGAVTTPVQFTGLVTSMTKAGHPVVSTPLGTLSLEVEARLPGGSRVAMELTAGVLPKAVEGPAPVATTRSLAHAWPALEEALAVLASTGAGPAQAVPHAIPQPGARLTSGMLFFMAALSGGNLGQWLGADALQTLRASGRNALIGRLSRDLARMGRMSERTGRTGSTGGEWRLLPIPLWNEDHVHQLRLFLRQHGNRRDGGKKRDEGDPTRFILELEMSRLGEIQLDGLIRDKRFDLMMRTREALPKQMQVDIQRIFEDANQAAGYSGNLGFQASSDWHFLPIDHDAATGDPPGLLV